MKSFKNSDFGQSDAINKWNILSAYYKEEVGNFVIKYDCNIYKAWEEHCKQVKEMTTQEVDDNIYFNDFYGGDPDDFYDID